METICGKEIIGFGNNPWPVKDSGCCCDECNSEFVIQARIEMLARRRIDTEKLVDLYSCDPAYYARDIAQHLVDRAVAFQKWISVEDRLPEPEQDVILCTREIETYGKHHEKKKIYRNIYMGYFDGDEWLTSYCHGCEYIFRMNEKYPNERIEVTHWMPLPEPPKGE